LAKNSKAKVKRANKNNGIDISGELNLPSLDQFETRSDFNKWKKQQKQFTDRKNEIVTNKYGVSATKQFIKEITRDTKKAQKNADEKMRERMNKPFISGGKEQGTQGQELLKMAKPNIAGITKPPNFNFNTMQTKRDLLKKRENMKKKKEPNYFDARLEKMKNSYIEELQKAFNSDANALVEKLRNVPSDDFYEMYMMFDEFDFNIFYLMKYLDSQDHDSLLQQLDTYIDRYQKGTLNPLFKLRNK
jgi:hypothetical protein